MGICGKLVTGSWERIRRHRTAASYRNSARGGASCVRSCWRKFIYTIGGARCKEHFNSTLPDTVVNFIWQIFALKDRHKVARQLVGVQERRENVFVSCGDGFVMHNRTGLKGIRHWLLVAEAVVARLHLRLLDSRVILIWLGSGFVEEAGLDGWSRLRVFWSAIKKSDVWNWLWRRLLTQWHHIVVVLENWL